MTLGPPMSQSLVCLMYWICLLNASICRAANNAFTGTLPPVYLGQTGIQVVCLFPMRVSGLEYSCSSTFQQWKPHVYSMVLVVQELDFRNNR